MTNNAHWPAIYRGATPVDISVVIPGSKSVTNRALILAAQAKSPSVLRRPLVSRDSELMMAGLKALGVGIEEKTVSVNGLEELQWIVTPAALRGGVKIDVGNAGTVMRFLPPLAALATGEVAFDGDPRSYERPLGPVIKALEELGVAVDHDNRYSLPLKLHGTGSIPGGNLTIDASASSQFLSALLLVAPSFEKGIVAKHQGGSLPSMPHIEMTVDMLRDFGATVEVDSANQSWSVKPGALHGKDLVIEPDLSNAGPFLAAAMVTKGEVTIPDWPQQTTQAGNAWIEILKKMGANVSLGEKGLTVKNISEIKGIDFDLSDVGELTPVLVSIALFANSTSTLSGIAHLRGHETDRLAALVENIKSIGGDAKETADGLIIRPAKLKAGMWKAFDDHRMATAGAVIGLVVSGIEVDDIKTTSKTLPDFENMWTHLVSV